MKRYICTLAASLCVSFPIAEAKQKIQYVGSSTVGQFMAAAVEVYDASAFSINTKAESGGGETAIAGGFADLGGVARDVKPEILSQGVRKFLIGHDAIGVWVHVDNPVNSLTKAQLKDIFTGKITNWKQVSGEDRSINVYVVNPQSATRKVFKTTILGTEEYSGKHISTIRPDSAVLEKVASDAGGIGQLSFAFGGNNGKVRKIAIGDQEATVNNPDYPIARPLYLITKGEPKPAVQEFIDWTLSDAGQNVVKRFFLGR